FMSIFHLITHPLTFLFFFSSSRPHRDLHSFPTRRSSDLMVEQFPGGATNKGNRSRRQDCGFDDILHHFVRHPGRWRSWRMSSNPDRKSTRLNSSHLVISYAVFCLKKKKKKKNHKYTKKYI